MPLGDYFDNPLAYTWCGVVERSCTCIYDGSGIKSDVPGHNCDFYDERLARLQAQRWNGEGAGGVYWGN